MNETDNYRQLTVRTSEERTLTLEEAVFMKEDTFLSESCLVEFRWMDQVKKNISDQRGRRLKE